MSYTEGYVVQSKDENKMCSNNFYNGLERRKSWPLQNLNMRHNLEIQWIDNYLGQNSHSMKLYELIFDKEILDQYLLECKKENLNVRVLYVKNIEDKGDINVNKRFPIIGYDLLYVADPYYSVLCEEFESVKNSGCANYLNGYGLFSTKEQLFEFIHWRQQHINDNGIEGEPLNEMCAVQLSLVKDFDKEKVTEHEVT